LIVHAEAGPASASHARRHQGHGARAGVALNPSTPVAPCVTVVDLTDLIL